MGMFDYVNFEVDCPNCGHRLKCFQSKDGPCDMGTVEVRDVSNFYTDCTGCGHWIEYTAPMKPNKIEDFEVSCTEDIT